MPTVLVVDDTAVDRRLAGGLLENAPNVEVCYAQNGNEALLRIGTDLPDLVLTDLQMPDLDGLELVTSINDRYPEVPVVLMTAHGSEMIAAQALANGAASYVPKTDLAESLVETVMHILVMADADSRSRKLIQCATKTEFEFNLDNDLELIDPLVELVQQIVSGQGILNQSDRIRLGVSMENALNNAMVRGNLELTPDIAPVINQFVVKERAEDEKYGSRRVYFRVLITPQSVECVIRDEGPGFDTSIVPDSGDPESFRDGSGRGLVLIKSFMDEVEFNDKGNELKLVKHCSVPVKPK